jgi:hypothetical protein
MNNYKSLIFVTSFGITLITACDNQPKSSTVDKDAKEFVESLISSRKNTEENAHPQGCTPSHPDWDPTFSTCIPKTPKNWNPHSDVIDSNGNKVWSGSDSPSNGSGLNLQRSECINRCNQFRSSCMTPCRFGDHQGACMSECSNALQTCESGCNTKY